MAEKRLLTEIKKLAKSPPQNANHQILSLAPIDMESSLHHWKAVIAKPTREDSNYYYNGKWTLDITTDSTYPLQPPTIRFNKDTPINHPNVNFTTGEICLDILKSDSWSPAWDLEHLVEAILMLVDDPEPDSPLNVDLANLFRLDKAAFESMVQYTMWKHGTLFLSQKDSQGTKAGNEDKKGDSEKFDSPESSGEEESSGKIVTQRLEVKSPETTFTLALSSPVSDVDHLKNLESIRRVGKEVTKLLLEKAKEVESKHENGDFKLLDAVQNQVSNNVAKQVEEICQSSASCLRPQYAS